MVENLVDHFNDDKIGLIVFAGDALRATAYHQRLCIG